MSLLELDPAVWALIALAFFVGGTVKGVIGMGMPLVVVPSLASFMPPTTAISLMIVPVIGANIWQVFHANLFKPTLRRFWTLLVTMAVVIWLASSVLVRVDVATASLLMGIVVIAYPISRLLPIRGETSRQRERWMSPTVGAVTGIVAGTAGLISPPLSIYLASLRLPKDEFVTAIALMLLCGATPLYINLALHDVLNLDVLIASCFSALPAWVGTALGTYGRQRISQRAFERALLGVLFLVGLNLLRRGLF